MATSLIGKKLFVFDLDGTLTTSKQPMTVTMADALFHLMGIAKVAVMSGGHFPQFQEQFVKSLPTASAGFENLYLLPTSGTCLYMWEKGWKEKYREDLTLDEKGRIMSVLKAAMATADYVKPPMTYGQLIEDRSSQITFSALGQNAPVEAKKQYDPTREKRERMAVVLRQMLPNFDVRVGGMTSIDITRRGVNKSYGIHKLEQYLNIPIAEMVFVGDSLFYGGNDYPVKATGIDCIEVKGPEETESVIRGWLK